MFQIKLLYSKLQNIVFLLKKIINDYKLYRSKKKKFDIKTFINNNIYNSILIHYNIFILF